MAYTVNWATKVVTIPKADTTLVSSSPDVRSLDVTTLWENLRDIEDNVDGIAYVAIVKNTAPVTLAGITFARQVEIINGYKLQFEDGQYAVNIIGGNSNVADVVVKNQVSVNTANSAGFTQGSGGFNYDAFLDHPNAVETGMTMRQAMRIMSAVLAGRTQVSVVPGGRTLVFRDVNDTKDRVVADMDSSGNRTDVDHDGT